MRIGLWTILASILAVGGHAALSQDAESDQKEMARRMQLAMALTAEHKALGDLVREWDMELQIVGMGKKKGTAKIDWLFEGRWLKLEMKVPGFAPSVALEAFAVMGYDKVKKAHVAMFCNNLDPGMTVMAGPKVEPADQTQVMYGTHDEYLTGELDKPIKYVTRLINKDKWILEVWDLGIGEAGKAVVVETFTRRP